MLAAITSSYYGLSSLSQKRLVPTLAVDLDALGVSSMQ